MFKPKKVLSYPETGRAFPIHHTLETKILLENGGNLDNQV
jgi:hypothetical protein